MYLKKSIFTSAFLAAIIAMQPAYAQLAGDSTAAGDSCASYPTGATTLVADSDTDNASVTLICDGSVWQIPDTLVRSVAGDPPTADGGGSSLWQENGSDIHYSSGNVGIGDANPSVALDVVGDIHYTGVLQDVSDIRLKENIHPLDSPLKKLTSLNGFSFTMIDDPKHVVEYGVSAQDVQKVFPELVGTVDPASGTLGVNYQGLIAPMIEAIKEQQAEIDALKARIEALEAPQTDRTPEEL